MTRWPRHSATTCPSDCWHDRDPTLSTLLLGVDGGATKTVALVADAGGTVIGAGRAGSSDIHSGLPPEAAVAEIVASVREAAAAAGVEVSDLRCAVFSLCGADWAEDVDYYEEHLGGGLALTGRISVMNDAFGALRAGTRDGIGAALVLGTGAAVAARGERGTTWFSGFRMEASGASEFGRLAYELLIRGEYGAGPVPSFGPAALEAFDVPSVEELIHAVTRRGGLGRRSLARLAPILLEAGHRGDPLVVPIIEEHGRVLAGYVRRAAQRVSLSGHRPTVVTSGGVFRHHCPDLADAFQAELDGFDVRASDAEPVYGALLAAFDLTGVDPDAERLRRSGPDTGYFATS